MEEWLLRQPTLTLPGSGGLVLPLAYGRFLVGILIVEREEPPHVPHGPAVSVSVPSATASSPAGDLPASTHARAYPYGAAESWQDGRAAFSAAGETHSQRQSRSGGSSFTAEQLRWIDRVAHGLAMACALDQRSALERAGNQADRLRVRGLVEEVRQVLGCMRCSVWS